MAAKVTFYPTDKLIVCKSGTIQLDVKVDLYSDTKEDWRTDSNLNKFVFPFVAVGGNPIDENEGIYVTSYYFLKTGWRVRPQESNHTLSVKGGILLTLEGIEPFVPTSGTYNVQVKYSQPIKTETVVTGGSGGLTEEEHNAVVSGAIQTSLLSLREGNVERSLYFATASIPIRNVTSGTLNYETIKYKSDDAGNWNNPIATYTLYAWYENLGDTQPKKLGALPDS